ncbi:geranylgeranyl pyrophosphate synthase [Streptomyces pluripotens]|uniref:Geranylgeranyl pyrophosphate synthase n=1 Tax=Streptomyces pluripotens TaxID=1355015 RepID=A0A221NUE8_9ACTN|nr:polyprenyl synthetase family protein [Streptomyces pluripotens]ARP68912.1 geranylgeranyl pyrophosphate synthase [Streptomyces pluripotens]ASN23165.1 geranylgeranyl pyrophosphate synthase [Streptomyces pluripotens]
MRSTEASHRHTAPPGAPPDRSRNDGPPDGTRGPAAEYGEHGEHGEYSEDGLGRGGDPRVVDGDVAGAVRAVLARLLAARLARGRALDTLFARDLAERVADFALCGGRRIRPRLLWWSLRACGGGEASQVRAALHAGAALELLQTCALVHDDLMDAAPTRRGRPALHRAVAEQYADSAPMAARRLGEAAAVLAGDLALAWADDLVTDLLVEEGDLPPGAARGMRDVWRATRMEMVAGQYLDVQGQATGVRTLTPAVRAACLKSALYSVERPLELGTVLAGASAGTTRALCRAGRCAGLAFQLRDDLDDLFTDPAVTGKPSGGDVREGKPTYLLAVARARAAADGNRTALAVLDTSLGRPDLSEDALDRVRSAVTATGAPDLVRGKIERLSGQALRHLADVDLEPRPAAELRTLFAEVTGAHGAVPEPAGGLPLAAALVASPAVGGER